MWKLASDQNQLRKAAEILDRIRAEEPSYWPYGLTVDQFDGGLYLVCKQASQEPVGFVGWQNREESGRRIGYYAIGILPEHRRQGFAKQAVAGVIRAAGSGVDEVRALVMEHNKPSQRLASSLGVSQVIKKLEKAANMGAAAKTALGIGGGATLAGILDLAVNKDRGAIGHYLLKNPDADPWTGADFLLNFAAGAGAAPIVRSHPGAASALTGLAALKTIATPAVRRMGDQSEAINRVAESLQEAGKAQGSGLDPKVMALTGVLGLGGLGLGAYATKRFSDHKERLLEEKSKGRMKVTLPTKNPNDAETVVEIPLEQIQLSRSLRSSLGRDARRRLLEETRSRTQKRKPRNPDKPTQRELDAMEVEKEMQALDKVANIADWLRPGLFKRAMRPLPPGSVPAPPALHGNPAHRMTQQQQAVAQSIKPSTEANPQIMEAQQKAQAAEQQSAMQAQQVQQEAEAKVQQVQQQAQQAQMEQQHKFQQMLADTEQKLQTTQLKLETIKAQADMEKVIGKVTAEQGSKTQQGVGRLIASRLKRVQNRLNKAGAVAPADAPKSWHAPKDWAERWNKDPAVGTQIKPISLYRHSYSKLGDSIFDLLIKNQLYTPSPNAHMQHVARSTAASLSPDKMGVLEYLRGQGAQLLHQPNPIAG